MMRAIKIGKLVSGSPAPCPTDSSASAANTPCGIKKDPITTNNSTPKKVAARAGIFFVRSANRFM